MKNFKEIREKYSSKFPPALIAAAVKIALDMGGNMTGAYKKIERMKRGLGDDPVVKDALRMANENVNEEVLNELNFSYAFFDKQSLNKFMLKALKIKGLEVVDSEKKQGGHYVVRVKSDDKKIIAKANSVAIKAMSEWVEEVNPQDTIVTIDEKVKAGKGKGKADVDYIGDPQLTKKLEKKFKVKIKSSGRTSADIIGNKANIIKLLQSDAYLMDDEDIEDLYPDLLEGALKEKYSAGNLNYAQDLDLAQKNMARLAKQEKGQEKKDYMAVARALNQGNLGAVKKIIKGISTDEIKADILNVLVGYNNLIAKMYPKAVDSKGRLKTPMNVSKMIK